MTGECQYCGRPKEGNAGDSYHEKQCEVDWCTSEIVELKGRLEELGARKRAIVEKLERVRERLERARYVGD